MIFGSITDLFRKTTPYFTFRISMALNSENHVVNTTFRTWTEEHNSSAQFINTTQCDMPPELSYTNQGSVDTSYWILSGVLVIVLNGCIIYRQSRQRTLYNVLQNTLMAANMFSGVVIHSIFAYRSQTITWNCNLYNLFRVCCRFYLIATLTSIALITFNRLMILTSVRAMQQSNFFCKVTECTSFCIYFSILFVSLAIALIPAYFPKVGPFIMNGLSIKLAIIIIALLFILHYKFHRVSFDRSESSSTADSGVLLFKRSLYVLRLTIVSMIFLWLPLVVVVATIRLFRLHSLPIAISVTSKLFWFRSVVDAIAQLAFSFKGRGSVIPPVAAR